MPEDADGKTPLHFAFDSSCVLFVDDHRNKESSTTTPPCHDVICVLLSGALAAATIQDADEMNPIEYAIMSSIIDKYPAASSSSKESFAGYFCVYLFMSGAYHDVTKEVTQSVCRQCNFM